MPITLRDQDGYYSREVEIGGTKFRIRELDDDTLDQVASVEAEIRRALQDAGLTPELALKAMQADTSQSPEVMAALVKLAEAPEDVARTLRQLQRQRRDMIVTRGLVGWDIPGTPFAPERAVLLPEWVKAALAQEIIQDSTMPEATQNFLSTSRGL
ncbi:MAG: hypothetical protein H5T86_01890 [Armatimonadetes bacterium]|nr:hypothetical protein [Armatimonadota bacterium]